MDVSSDKISISRGIISCKSANLIGCLLYLVVVVADIVKIHKIKTQTREKDFCISSSSHKISAAER